MVQQRIFFADLKRALITQSTTHLSKKRRGSYVFIMNDAYCTLCAQHTSALPPSPVRETREGVSVRPQQPTGAVSACSFTGGKMGPVTSLAQPSSSVCRG